MDEKNDEKIGSESKRRRYESPQIIEEQVFERHALQACDKLAGEDSCTDLGASPNIS